MVPTTQNAPHLSPILADMCHSEGHTRMLPLFVCFHQWIHHTLLSITPNFCLTLAQYMKLWDDASIGSVRERGCSCMWQRDPSPQPAPSQTCSLLSRASHRQVGRQLISMATCYPTPQPSQATQWQDDCIQLTAGPTANRPRGRWGFNHGNSSV